MRQSRQQHAGPNLKTVMANTNHCTPSWGVFLRPLDSTTLGPVQWTCSNRDSHREPSPQCLVHFELFGDPIRHLAAVSVSSVRDTSLNMADICDYGAVGVAIYPVFAPSLDIEISTCQVHSFADGLAMRQGLSTTTVPPWHQIT